MTTQPLTDEQHAAIRAREAAATPGPWFNDGHEIYVGTPDDYTRDSLWIGETCNIDLPDRGDANGAFLAHARQDVPALLAEVDRLRAELEQARDLVRDLADPDPCDHLDHHGYCQTHGWFAVEPPCPHGRAQQAGLVHDDEEES